MQDRTWKLINGFRDSYEISNMGEIRRACPDKRNHKPKLMKVGIDKVGYCWLCLYDGEKYKKVYVHRLVIEAFNGKIETNKQVNHKDGIKNNNHIANLECVTAMENIHHAIRLGLRNRCKGGSEWKYKTNYKK